jgi:hypothetical protein
VPPRSIGAAKGQYLAQRLAQVCVRRIWHRPVASNTELKMQRAAAASMTSRMSTPESEVTQRLQLNFPDVGWRSRDLAGQLADGCSGSVDSSTRGFRVLGWTLALFRWPRVHSGGGLLALSYRISRDTIHKHIKRAGVPFHERGLTEEQKTEAERLYLFGWSLQRLADRYGK